MVALRDKFKKEDSGNVYMSGVDALVRLPLTIQRRDAERGKNTAGFISGYRGSPLGNLDKTLVRHADLLAEHNITFLPGLNEDLAATAVAGTQLVEGRNRKTSDGVFGMWYGKGPGVDRSGDALRHTAGQGTSANGGLLFIAGDDHKASSSTIAMSSSNTLATWGFGVLVPSDHQDYLELGVIGTEMSRATGLPFAMSAVGETAEVSGSVDLSVAKRDIVIPEEVATQDLNIAAHWDRFGVGTTLLDRRLSAAESFSRANNIDYIPGGWDGGDKPVIGIAALGKSYTDVRQALYQLGIDEKKAKEIGIRLYHVRMPWPLNKDGIRHFSQDLNNILVVEEMGSTGTLVESQIKQILFDSGRSDIDVLGKKDKQGRDLLPTTAHSVSKVAKVIAAQILPHIDDSSLTDEIKKKIDFFDGRIDLSGQEPGMKRVPHFCSGCPHSKITIAPEGTQARTGISCGILADQDWGAYKRVGSRGGAAQAHMGAEGMHDLGARAFVDDDHVFVSLGDGTYNHSGSLAIRAAVAATATIPDLSMTYKIAFNSVAAMTGGQGLEGDLTVEKIAAQLQAEGVKRVAVVSDNPSRFKMGISGLWKTSLPSNVGLYDRADLAQVQDEFAGIKGISAIIYDEECAAELRRKRRHGLAPQADERVIINADICEGCHDCSRASGGCISIQPVQTKMGVKRRIDQDRCNIDTTCTDGFCPSFVTVEGGVAAQNKLDEVLIDQTLLPLPMPKTVMKQDNYNIVLAGVGGEGIVSTSEIIGFAAHIEGKRVFTYNNTGLSQKGGAVISHVRFAQSDSDGLWSKTVPEGMADLVLGYDGLTAADNARVLPLTNPDKTVSFLNKNVLPTIDFLNNPSVDFRAGLNNAYQALSLQSKKAEMIECSKLGQAAMGSSFGSNMFMLGYAFQKGYLPLHLSSIKKAISENKVTVEENLLAFQWGRRMAHQPELMKKALARLDNNEKPDEKLDDVIAHRHQHLIQYQDADYAGQYMNIVERAKKVGDQLKSPQFAMTVAKNLAKVMAYKDEYEVSRLHAQNLQKHIEKDFSSYKKLRIHLAPPFLNTLPVLKYFFTDAAGKPRKISLPGYAVLPLFRALQRGKKLRGTKIDVFGMTAERKIEKRLRDEYIDAFERIELLSQRQGDALTTKQKKAASGLMALPDDIRGFGHVKHDNIEIAQKKAKELWDTISPRVDSHSWPSVDSAPLVRVI